MKIAIEGTVYIGLVTGVCLTDFGNNIICVVTSAMRRDGRISPKFLHCRPGYGGSCFPKKTDI